MRRLIDANELAVTYCDIDAKYSDEPWLLRDILAFLNDAPTADAVEVVHGEWVQIGYDEYMDRVTCSHCKEYFNIMDNNIEAFNYCPNCGAKMDGGNYDV